MTILQQVTDTLSGKLLPSCVFREVVVLVVAVKQEQAVIQWLVCRE